MDFLCIQRISDSCNHQLTEYERFTKQDSGHAFTECLRNLTLPFAYDQQDLTSGLNAEQITNLLGIWAMEKWAFQRITFEISWGFYQFKFYCSTSLLPLKTTQSELKGFCCGHVTYKSPCRSDSSSVHPSHFAFFAFLGSLRVGKFV